jgi:S1-C subfamily serine protease
VGPQICAVRSGLQVRDIILAVNRAPVTSVAALPQKLAATDKVPALTGPRGPACDFIPIR